MKPIIIAITLLIGLQSLAFSETYTLEEDTPIQVETVQPIILKKIAVGDPVALRTSQDIQEESANKVLIPKGTIVTGLITEVDSSNPKRISLELRKLKLLNGQNVSLQGNYRNEAQEKFSVPRFLVCSLAGGILGMALGYPFYSKASGSADIKPNTTFLGHLRKTEQINLDE